MKTTWTLVVAHYVALGGGCSRSSRNFADVEEILHQIQIWFGNRLIFINDKWSGTVL